MSILFTNAEILIKKDGQYTTLHNAYLGVEGKNIDYVSEIKPEKQYDVVKDFSKKLIMQGFVNSHTHSPMVLLRGLGSGHSLQEWLYDYVFPTEATLTPEEIKWSSYYAILEMLACGTCSFTDMYFYPEETAKAVIDSGIKANINKYITSFDENAKVEDSNIFDSLDFFEKYHNQADGRLKIDFSVHAEYTNQAHIVKEYSRIAKIHGGRMHIHLSETKEETNKCYEKYGMTPTRWFESLGTLDVPTTAAHCVWVNAEDCKILKEHNVSIAHNPTSNMILGSGFAPLGKFKRFGLNVTLGTDGCASNNNLNMFEEMHVGLLMSDGFHLDPLFLTYSEIIDMATINGQKAQGRDNSGAIEVGKCADIIGVDLDKIHLYPQYDMPTLIVSSMQGSDVCMTMVDGNILYEDGKYLTLDKDLIIGEFSKCASKIKLKKDA